MTVYQGKANKVKAWSHSAWATYEQCPLKYKLEKIDKLAKPEGPALERGRKIHDDIANVIQHQRDPALYREDFQYHHDLIDQLFNAYAEGAVVVEQQWGFNETWKPTGWFGSDIWVRAIVDALITYDDMTAEVVDWKTGKRYGSNDDQMEIFAVTTGQKLKDYGTITTRLAYVDSNEQEIVDWTPHDRELLKDKWTEKVQPMFHDTEWLPRPNDKCRFCPFAKDKGGQCRYG